MLRGNRTTLYRHGLVILLAGVVIGWSQAGMAQGQPQYAVLPIDEQLQPADSVIDANTPEEDKKKIRAAIQWKGKLQIGIAAIRRGSPPRALDNESNKANFDQWFKGYYFATLTHPEHLSEWPKRRQEFLKRMEQTNAPDVHEHLRTLTRQVMLTIVKGNFHPVARYNAMLFLGQLNDTEATLIGQKKSPPIPFTQGLGDAIQEYNDPKQIDAVRVAALVTMLRHARIDRQLVDTPSPLGALRGQMGNLAFSLVKTKEAPDGRSQEGHDWMRRRAIEILGELGNPGGNGEVSSALLAVLNDDQTPISLRCSAAEALAQLKYAAAGTINVAETAKSMGKVAAHACYDEIRRVEAQQEREQTAQDATIGGSTMGGMYGGASSGMFGTPSIGGTTAPDPLAYRIALTRRRVKHRAMSIKKALVGEEKKKRRPVAFAGFDKPEAKTDGSTPAEEEEELSGILAVAENDTDREYVRKVAEQVGFIIGQVDDDSFKDLTSLVSEIRKKVREMEQACGIVVNVDEMEVESKEAEGLLDDPLKDLGSGLGGIPSVDPAMPPDGTTGKTPHGPEGKPPVAPAKKDAVVPPATTPVTPPVKGPVVPPATTPVAPSPKKVAPAIQP